MRTLSAALLLSMTAGIPCLAQDVPAWYPHRNGVAPSVQVAVALDPASGDFRYRYTVTNLSSATQRLNMFYLEVPVPVSGAEAPTDWEVVFEPPPPDLQWGPTGDIDPSWTAAHELDEASYRSEIAPGQTLPGFDLRSPCGAGTGLVTFYAQGYNHTPRVPPGDTTSWVAIPQWRDDAVRGQVLGPGNCQVVADWGNRRPGVDGFVGLVNFADGATLPAGPVTFQFRFARGGEQVDRSTFRTELNQVDVTSRFVTNSLGDKVAVFQPGEARLRAGRNVMLVSVDGIVPGTTRTATDADRFTFTVP